MPSIMEYRATASETEVMKKIVDYCSSQTSFAEQYSEPSYQTDSAHSETKLAVNYEMHFTVAVLTNDLEVRSFHRALTPD